MASGENSNNCSNSACSWEDGNFCGASLIVFRWHNGNSQRCYLKESRDITLVLLIDDGFQINSIAKLSRPIRPWAEGELSSALSESPASSQGLDAYGFGPSCTLCHHFAGK